MLPSKTRYLFAYIPHFLKSLPTLVFDTAAYLLPFYFMSSKLKNGMRVVDFLTETPDQFISLLEAAFELIRLKDPMRFARLNREIRMIVHMPTRTGAESARRPLKVCKIDPEKFKAAFDISRDYGIQILASVLIHEATHGSLYTRRVIQTKRNYTRVEKLCCLEQERFARKLGMDEITCSIFREAGETAKPSSFLERFRAFKESAKRI